MSVSVGEFIRQQLKVDRNKMTMKELAAKANINATYLSRVVKGNIKASPKFLRAIAPHLQGTSLQELMAVAGHLTPDDEPENETMEDLELRIKDLRTKLSEAIAKSIRANDDREEYHDADKEIKAFESALTVLLDCAHNGTIRSQFGFTTQQETLDLVKGLNSLYRKQKKMLYDFVEEFNRMNAAANRY